VGCNPLGVQLGTPETQIVCATDPKMAHEGRFVIVKYHLSEALGKLRPWKP